MESNIIHLLITDDSQAALAGLRALFKGVTDVQLVSEASGGGEAIRLAERLQPDVVLMDLHMPDMNGIEATRQIVHTSPHIAVLVLTMYDDDDSVFAAMQAGARGYLLKGASKKEMLRAIRDVLVLMAQHHSNQEVAQSLSLSPKTVRNYISNIFAKLQVADRAGAILKARDAGLR
jgi:DNA-binding NarL/FixJ family response regulator